jgi:hypothetical protein
MAIVSLVAGAAISLLSAKKSNDAAKKAAEAQRQAAELQTKVARELHEHWKAFYMQCDIATIQEVCATPIYAADYNGVAARVTQASLREFARARLMVENCQEHFCVENADCNFMAGIQAQATADAMNFGFRREEGVKEQVDQIRLENKRSFLALGRGLLKSSADASSIAAKLGAALQGWVGKAAAGWLEFAGYLGTPQGKQFGDDVTKGLRGIFSGRPESPSRSETSNSDQTIDYSYAVTRDQGVPTGQAPRLPPPASMTTGDGGGLIDTRTTGQAIADIFRVSFQGAGSPPQGTE